MVVAQEMRSIPLDHGVGFVVRGEKKYLIKSFVRDLLLVVQSYCPDAFDNVPMEQVLRWTPNQHRHVDRLKAMTGCEVRSKLGLNILLVSCWASLAARVEITDLRKLLRLGDEEWSTEFHMYAKEQYDKAVLGAGEVDEDPPFAPGPHVILMKVV